MRMVMFVLGLAIFAFALIAGQKQLRDGGFAAVAPAAAPKLSEDNAGLMAAMMDKAKAFMGSETPSASSPAGLPQVSPQAMSGDIDKAVADFEQQFTNSPAGALAMPMITAKRKATKGGARFVKVTPRN